MPRMLLTGNHAAGRILAMAGEANRSARGCAGGAYPITPQTEIIEYLRSVDFTKGRIVPVESEHSAMAVCIGAALAGARTFTASSANGLSYMTENVFAAGYYRLPVVMIAVNRTLGPPWNIWVDQGDSLALRDAAWLQFYTEAHQDLVDTILLAFRVAEDPRVLLPAMVALDGFVVSHTQMVVDLPTQEQVDAFLPPCRIPHALRADHPATVGGLTWPAETAHHRREIQEAMERAPEVLDEAIDEFERCFGRRPSGALAATQTDDAETVLISCNTMSRTLRDVVRLRRAAGEKVGMINCKLFRPFPRQALRDTLGHATRVGVLDRNHSPGSGGIFWQEVAATLCAPICDAIDPSRDAVEPSRDTVEPSRDRKGAVSQPSNPTPDHERPVPAAARRRDGRPSQSAVPPRATAAHAPIIQDYIVGLGGGDVTPAVLNEIFDDLQRRDHATAPIWREVAL